MRKFFILLLGILLVICSSSCNLYPLYIKILLDKYKLSLNQINIFGTCINVGLWVGFPMGYIYDKYGSRISLIFGLLFLPGSFLILHYLININTEYLNIPFLYFVILGTLMGQGSSICYTTAISINLNNFNLKDSSLLVSLIAVNMSIGSSFFAFYKENIKYFKRTNFYIFLTFFISFVIILCMIVFKNTYKVYTSEEKAIKSFEKLKNLEIIKAIFKFNISICLIFIIGIIAKYSGVILISKIIIFILPILILLQFIFVFFYEKNYSDIYKEKFILNKKNKNDEVKINNFPDKNYTIKELDIITIPNFGNKNLENSQNYIIENKNNLNNNLVNYENDEFSFDISKNNKFNNSSKNKINNLSHINSFEELENNNYKNLILIFVLLFFGMGSIISNYNNMQFIIDSIYKGGENMHSNPIYNSTKEENFTKNSILFNLINSTELNKYKFQDEIEEIDHFMGYKDFDFWVKKEILFYIVVYFTCNGVVRIFSTIILQYLIEKKMMFYHPLFSSILGLISQILGIFMNKNFLFFTISLCGCTHGLYMTFTPMFVKKFYDPKNFGKILGFLTTGAALGSLVNSNFLFIYFYDKYGVYTNENDNIKYCREKNCFSYSYIINSLFLSVNILICLFLILKKKLGFE